MKEICFVGIGDSVKKLNYKLGINSQSKIEDSLVFGYNYVTVTEGSEDIQVVKNYKPYYISDNVNEDILIEKGYKIICICGSRVVYNLPSGVKYSVKPLETLEEISNKFGVSIDEIMLSNKLNTNKLFVGQVLYI